jgi:hypothetical protein
MWLCVGGGWMTLEARQLRWSCEMSDFRFSQRWLWRMPSYGMWRRVDLRNVGSHKIYTASHSRRRHSTFEMNKYITVQWITWVCGPELLERYDVNIPGTAAVTYVDGALNPLRIHLLLTFKYEPRATIS